MFHHNQKWSFEDGDLGCEAGSAPDQSSIFYTRTGTLAAQQARPRTKAPTKLNRLLMVFLHPNVNFDKYDKKMVITSYVNQHS